VLKEKKLGEKIIREAAQVASDEIQPRSRPWYRREMTKVLVERAILQAMEKIR
jgi:CO/xanthine dehydrogenase FAD-binding subunit